MKQNVSDRGPFGKLYRVWGDGKQMVKGDKMDYFGVAGYTDDQLRKMGYIVWMPVQAKGSWLGEGDNGTFMNVLGNGLRAWEDPSYGGWGGRSIRNQDNGAFFQLSDTSQQAMVSALSSMNNNANTYPNFFPAAQNDFAIRMKWSVTPKYTDANHAPVITIENPLHVLASPGETIRLNANCTDPDNDKVTIKWWQFQVGTYPDLVPVSNANSTQAKVLIPKNAIAGQTIHIILEATDDGLPPLTRYQRIIITVK